MSDDRPTRYIEDDRVVYRASGLGACTRALVAYSQPTAYLPAEKPAWFQTILDEGRAFESAIRERYCAEKLVDVVDDQLEVELELGEMFGREVIIRGHIDGRVDNPMEPDRISTLFEAKKFRDSTWPDFLRRGIEINANYPWQVAVYMLALELDECDFVGGHVVELTPEVDIAAYAVIPDGIRKDANGRMWSLTEIAVKRITMPPFSLKAIRNRILAVEKLIAAGYDAKEVECNRSMYPCPYFKLHDYDEDAWEWKDAEQHELADAWMMSLASVSDDVQRAKATLEAAEARKAEIVAGIRELIAQSGDQANAAKKLLGTDYTLSHIRKTIPAHLRKESVQDYFTIKPNKKEESE